MLKLLGHQIDLRGLESWRRRMPLPEAYLVPAKIKALHFGGIYP